MVKRTGPQSLALQNLINDVKEASDNGKVKLWKRIGYELERSTRQRRSVNLYKIDKSTRENEIALVPGKVLSLGDLTKGLTVTAYQFSKEAKEKINKNGKAVLLKDFIKENKDPKGKRIRIIG
ncbi:50S ribosomal protein L18e [archaeon]|nr:50S ribosomal protein L18e [archaeon]|tara:strand:+ start:1218 stop:1586 length:369 start_codon:yes stop_codon:yes gene_type:complete